MSTYGIKDLCERYGVGEHTVLNWIHRGELTAINVGRNAGGKPKWRVTPEAVAAFELRRSPERKTEPRTRRRRRPVEVIDRY